jgi:hypothetical protein
MGTTPANDHSDTVEPSLERFFRELPESDGTPSRFTATQVAEQIRKDRDAAD